MGLEKITYVDGTTVITAKNLNDIQDSIIDLEAARTVPSNVRSAILTLLESAAYAETGLEDEIAIVQSWAEEITSLTLSVSTLSLYEDEPQIILATTVPSGVTVYWTSSDESVATVSDGVVTGVSNGSCVITASAGDLSATCDVTVEGFAELVSISAVYTQSGDVYEDTPLNDLKDDLVVTATYSDSSTETIPSADYTLSGTLTEGTSTIYVVYGGKTTTFSVSVTSAPLYHLETPTLINTKQVLSGVTPFANGYPITILFDFTLSAGGAITNGTRLFGLDGELWSFGMGSAYGRTFPGGSTAHSIWAIAGSSYSVKLCPSASGLVKDTIYRLAMTYDPTNLVTNVYFKGGDYDVTGSIELESALIYSNAIGFNTGSYIKEFTANQFDIYKSILSSSDISAFLNGE